MYKILSGGKEDCLESTWNFWRASLLCKNTKGTYCWCFSNIMPVLRRNIFFMPQCLECLDPEPKQTVLWDRLWYLQWDLRTLGVSQGRSTVMQKEALSRLQYQDSIAVWITDYFVFSFHTLSPDFFPLYFLHSPFSTTSHYKERLELWQAWLLSLNFSWRLWCMQLHRISH